MDDPGPADAGVVAPDDAAVEPFGFFGFPPGIEPEISHKGSCSIMTQTWADGEVAFLISGVVFFSATFVVGVVVTDTGVMEEVGSVLVIAGGVVVLSLVSGWKWLMLFFSPAFRQKSHRLLRCHPHPSSD